MTRKKQILNGLANGPMSRAEIKSLLGVQANTTITSLLAEKKIERFKTASDGIVRNGAKYARKSVMKYRLVGTSAKKQSVIGLDANLR